MNEEDIKKNLSSLFSEQLQQSFPNSQIKGFIENKFNSGVESTIYFFYVESLGNSKHTKKVKKLVLKIYNGVISTVLFDPNLSSITEFELLKRLRDENLSIPKAYAHGKSGNEYFRDPYIVMDFIEGEHFSLYCKKLVESNKQEKINQLIDKINIYLMKINSVDYSPYLSLFPDAIKDRDRNYYLTHDIDIWKKLLREKQIQDKIFDPMFNWVLEYGSKVPLSKYSLVNRDFKLNNFIITNQEEPILLDWSISYITDHRLALGFCLMGLQLNPSSVISKEQFLQSYKKVAEEDLENTDFFESLALIKNLGILMIIFNRSTSKEDKEELLSEMKKAYSLLQDLSNQSFYEFKQFLHV